MPNLGFCFKYASATGFSTTAPSTFPLFNANITSGKRLNEVIDAFSIWV